MSGRAVLHKIRLRTYKPAGLSNRALSIPPRIKDKYGTPKFGSPHWAEVHRTQGPIRLQLITKVIYCHILVEILDCDGTILASTTQWKMKTDSCAVAESLGCQ